MVNEFINNLAVPHNKWHVPSPYFYVRIDSYDNADIIEENLLSWQPGDSIERPLGSWVGLLRSDSNSNITFTRTLDLPKTGKYLIEVYGWKRPQVSSATAGDMTLTIDGTTVLTENMHNDWEDYGSWIQSDIVDITDDGSAVFVLTVPKQAFAAFVRVIPITRYEGGSEYNGPSETRLDLIDINFTTNGVNEVDDADITIAFKEDFYTDDNPYSTLAFDAWDEITIVAGEDKRTAVPMFGGYISGWKLNDDSTELSITAIDSISRLGRTFVQKNFSIGYIPEETTGKMPFTQFPNVNEIARYLCSSDFPINFEAITRDYAYYKNFAVSSDVTGMTNSGFVVDWQPGFGNPAPSMRIRPGHLNEASLTIYSDTLGTWDAAVHNYFNFDYYVSGAGVLFPPKFNIEIDMYKDEQTSASAVTYTIPFTGTTVVSNILKPVLPKFDGTWNSFLVDLKDMFNKSSGASTHYYISAIRFVGTPDESQILNNKCASMYIDHIMGYRDFQSAPRYASADSKTPLHELQDMCEKCNQIAYVRPGLQRNSDQLIMIPKLFYTLPITITEGDNLLEVSNLEYKPIDWGLSNKANRTFNYDENRSGSVNVFNADSVKWYGAIHTHEFLSDVKTEQDAKQLANYDVDKNSFWYPSFDVTVKGTTLFEPGQYVNVYIPSKRLNGTHEVQSLSFKFDCVNNYFTTTISFNAPHRTFMQFMKLTMKNQKMLESLSNNFTYKNLGGFEGGMNTSAGAYTRT